MSYLKLDSQKSKHTNENMANRISTKKLKDMLSKTQSGKIKGKILIELSKRNTKK